MAAAQPARTDQPSKTGTLDGTDHGLRAERRDEVVVRPERFEAQASMERPAVMRSAQDTLLAQTWRPIAIVMERRS